MTISRRFGPRFRPSLAFVLLCGLLAILLVAGGASRADATGQVVVRGAAWIALIVTILFGPRPTWDLARPVAILLALAVLLVLLQLLPLPPSIWQSLPGRRILIEAAAVSGQDQPWRPWSIVPGATVNAASSLIVPAVTLLLLAGTTDAERARLPALILGLVATVTLVGLLQLSGAGIDNPLINESPTQMSGTFANRNHFALCLALGCLAAPVWAMLDGRRPGWRAPVAVGLVLLFVLTILASGSRAGLMLGMLALVLGLVLSRQGIRKALEGYPRWVFPALIAGVIGMVVIFVLISLAADRAVSIDRVFAGEEGQDMRSRGLPTVLAMTRTYFPWGIGLGSFDPMFRVHEPFALLKPTYFNHAHNDLLEIVLDAGLAGGLLLLAGLTWCIIASARAWQAGAGMRHALPKLGSAMLLLIVLASAFDYPARTPIIMALVVIAGFWLTGAPGRARQERATHAALPVRTQPL